jgi:hypothetical protein
MDGGAESTEVIARNNHEQQCSSCPFDIGWNMFGGMETKQ